MPPLQDSRWSVYGHGSQLVISAEFDGDEPPTISLIKETAHRLASTHTNFLSLNTLRVFQVEIVGAIDDQGSWVFGADVPGLTPAQGYVRTAGNLFMKLSPWALGILVGLLEDFQHVLQQPSRSPMYAHRLLESLAWYYATDDDKQTLAASDWATMWEKIGLADSEERIWALQVLQPAATRIRHGRHPKAAPQHPEVVRFAKTVIDRLVASEIVENSAK